MKKMNLLGEILKAFRIEVLDVSQKEFSRILRKESPLLKISKSTIGAYERNDRPKQIHGSAELYRVFKELFGVDLSESLTEKCIVVEDLTKLTPNNVQQLKKLHARFKNIPILDKYLPPFNGQEKYPEPVFPVRSELCPTAEFGILAIDNSMAPIINKGDCVFCGELLTVDDVKLRHTYLISLDNGAGRTSKIGKAEKKGKDILLVPANSNPSPIAFSDEAVRGIFKVVGHYRAEVGINQ